MRGQVFWIVGWETHLKEGVEWSFEANVSLAAIDEDGYAGDDATVLLNDLHRLVDAAAASDDVLDDENAFARSNFEAAAKLELVVDFFHEDVALVELASDLLADYEASHRGGEYGVELDGVELWLEQLDESADFTDVLADLGALEEEFAAQS